MAFMFLMFYDLWLCGKLCVFADGKLGLEKVKAHSHYRGNQHGSVPRLVNADE